MKPIAILLLAVASALCARAAQAAHRIAGAAVTPGVVAITPPGPGVFGTVTAYAGAANTSLGCTATGNASPATAIKIVCVEGGAAFPAITETFRPGVSIIRTYLFSGNTVALMVWQPAAGGPIQFQATANGTTGKGTF